MTEDNFENQFCAIINTDGNSHFTRAKKAWAAKMYRNVHTIVYKKSRDRKMIINQHELWDESGNRFFASAFQQKMVNEDVFASEFPEREIKIPKTYETNNIVKRPEQAPYRII